MFKSNGEKGKPSESKEAQHAWEKSSLYFIEAVHLG